MYPDLDDENDDEDDGFSEPFRDDDEQNLEGEEKRGSENRQKLNAAAIKVISRALPPQVWLCWRCTSYSCVVYFNFCPPRIPSLFRFDCFVLLMRQRGQGEYFILVHEVNGRTDRQERVQLRDLRQAIIVLWQNEPNGKYFLRLRFLALHHPQQVPRSKPLAPLGLYELSVVERSPELDVPPPPDIFGGDTPAGMGKAGMGEVPVLRGAADRTWRGKRRLSEEDAWPEEGQVFFFF